ncbi:cryptochrome/photolyase family protein [Marinicella meishanensis]|uniref:cryptochrome/photolyase family protein n=1 Tax=Marinicella meishanensis TaxID=2873263 RepID=UPI001CBD5128|nr:cryptochrome/photolyase family protein [Marinicella sp. NBU2979]
MKVAHLIFPHQLFKDHPLIATDADCWLIELSLFFTQYPFHQQKIAFHRASMQAFAAANLNRVNHFTYIEAHNPCSQINELISELAAAGYQGIKTIDSTDDWVERQLSAACNTHGIERQVLPSPLFINNQEDLADFFRTEKDHFFHHQFYQQQRRRLNLLMDRGKPLGGQWSFDQENRKKYPKEQQPPAIKWPEPTAHHQEATAYVKQHFQDHLGNLTAQHGFTAIYPITPESAAQWLDDFLRQRFAEFGPYEDAMVKEQLLLHHSVLTPMLNVGLLSPTTVINRCLSYAQEHDIPLNSLEGFVRQVIGWREFIRGLYETVGRRQRTRNFWGFKRPIPATFYTGNTGIEPVDVTIKKVLDTGYCHHIERLMILGNFMLLCEFDPDTVYQWFMELFIDAYDWVMVPNVYGMSQFADGGLMATKPYISSSNYVLKMSDFAGGKQAASWRRTWDGLFWRFMHRQRDFFAANPRLGMLLKTWDRMNPSTQQNHLNAASEYLDGLDAKTGEA